MTETEVQWCVYDRATGDRIPFTNAEDAVGCLVRRVRWGVSKEENVGVFMRVVATTEWKEMGRGTGRNEGGDPGGTPDTPAV